eukprot:1136435-Pelagomonas_calceolata.AAC.4
MNNMTATAPNQARLPFFPDRSMRGRTVGSTRLLPRCCQLSLPGGWSRAIGQTVSQGLMQ